MSVVHHPAVAPDVSGGRLAENVMHFARVLRRAGLPVGPGRVIDGLMALSQVGVRRRDDVYWALHAVFVNRRDQRELFDQAFHVFWRNPKILERMQAMLLPAMRYDDPDAEKEELSRRVADAMAGLQADGQEDDGGEEVEFDAALTWSGQEVLRGKDFEKMSAAEVVAAKRLIASLRLPIVEVATRRYRPDPAGARIDMRRTLRASLRSGAGAIPLIRRKRRTRHPPLVVMCDISGSMDRYARMLLHFLHAITNDRDRVHTFLFGTRLTNVTRHLKGKDVDVALDRISNAVADWAGGTRIGNCLDTFNRDWSRRVLGQGAVVLLISDGLDRDSAEGLEAAMERLHKSCRRLIWLNPLLRYDGYEPRTAGARAMMPHVDDFRTIHNLDSLAALTEVLARDGARRPQPMARWREMAA